MGKSIKLKKGAKTHLPSKVDLECIPKANAHILLAKLPLKNGKILTSKSGFFFFSTPYHGSLMPCECKFFSTELYSLCQGILSLMGMFS